MPASEAGEETVALTAAEGAEPEGLNWGDSDEGLTRRAQPVAEPRSRLRKFVYLVVALMPFIAFILLLPRGGEVPDEEVEPQPIPSVTSAARVQLAFPFDTSPSPLTPVEPPADPEDDVSLEAPGNTQCSDGADNDRDGRIDTADAGCTGTRDNSEFPNPVRRTAAPPPPAPRPAPMPAPPPAPMPAPPPVPPAPDPDPDPDPPNFPPPGPPCEPGDRGFPNCNNRIRDNDDDEPQPEDPPEE